VDLRRIGRRAPLDIDSDATYCASTSTRIPPHTEVAGDDGQQQDDRSARRPIDRRRSRFAAHGTRARPGPLIRQGWLASEVGWAELSVAELALDLLHALAGEIRHPEVDEKPSGDIQQAVEPHPGPTPMPLISVSSVSVMSRLVCAASQTYSAFKKSNAVWSRESDRHVSAVGVSVSDQGPWCAIDAARRGWPRGAASADRAAALDGVHFGRAMVFVDPQQQVTAG
jgi:hypothetical protein